MKSSRIENSWPIAREGLPFVMAGAVVTPALFYFGFQVAGTLFGLLTLFTFYFFRDPERTNPAEANAVLAPADGRVVSVREVEADRSPLGMPAVRASIFMSVFDVHVNRIPVSGIVHKIDYQPGAFLAAHQERASERNESNRILLMTADSRPVMLVQIAGLVARRIVCWIREQEPVLPGQRFGLIRFGSRVDIYLPSGSRITVEPGRRVRAGETIIGYLS